MKILAFNGSPRKEWNTATLLKSALKGAESKGASTEWVHLYDLNYKGCTSCFACKLKGGKSYGRCAMKDGLTPFLKKVEEADALIIGSPVYIGAETGETRSFLERLIFPYLTYTDPPRTLFPKKIPVGLIFTLGATEEMACSRGWDAHLASTESSVGRMLGETRMVCSYDTYQFDDYSKYEASRFDPAAKLKRRRKIFPQDERRAFELGTWLAGG
jgi:multimeric flavodoxin WrbA